MFRFGSKAACPPPCKELGIRTSETEEREMSDYQKLAKDLMTSLELSLPPIVVSFSDVAPASVPRYDGVVPAGCVFWQIAATRTFVTSAKDHELCAIGVHTHNIAGASASHPLELQEALKAMSGLDYVREEEVAAIPSYSVR